MDWKKYVFVLIITIAIFATSFYISAYFNNKRVAEMRAIENKISLDLLSSETQFALLSEASCKDIGKASVLSTEINTLAEKLSYMEEKFGKQNEEVLGLKMYYSLLEIKDYLLMKRVSTKCGVAPISMLYFYSNAGDCALCEQTGYVLTYLTQQHPQVRVYSFDYNIDLSAVKTLIAMFKVKNTLPAVVIGEDVHYGVSDLAGFEKLIPSLKEVEKKTPAATSKNTK
ncbi:MAG: hypothetical protein V1902_02415 [Candidatus Falkowbacteria bacterium]